MRHTCPKCSQPLDRRALFFKAVSTCPHCGQALTFGSLGAYLAFALSWFGVMMAVLVLAGPLFGHVGWVLVAGFLLGALVASGVLYLSGRARIRQTT
ncbi:MAG: hypothetical protein RL748_1684 [Pseudomonadota bacterium]|jgi:uncharacterized protein (DUF983 family)